MTVSASVIRAALIVGGLVLIEVLCRLEWVQRITMVPPTQIFMRLAQMTQEGEFWTQARSTIQNIAIAAVCSWIFGFIAGLLLHALPRVRRSVEPLLASYYALPFFVFYPLAVVMLGMNNAPIILMAAMFAVVSMITSTLIGLDRIPAVLGKVGRVYRLNPLKSALLIQLPATLPHVFAGIKLALGYSVAGVIASEFILSSSGLGYSIAFAYNAFDSPTMYAYLVFVILLVTVILSSVNWIERRLQYRIGSNWTITTSSKRADKRWVRLLESLAVAATLLAIWQLLHLQAGSEAMASPATTFRRIASMIETPRFWAHTTETSRALVWSLILSCVGGGALGIVLGANRRAGEIFEPMVIALQSTPKVTLYPVILLFFGIGLAAKVAFGVLHGFIPMTLVTLSAVRSINPALLRTGRALRLSTWQMLSTVQFPAVLPEMVTGMRLGFSITFLGVLVGELFASQRGLGFLIMNSITLNDVPTIMAVTVLIGAFAVCVNVGLLAIDNRLHR